MKWFVLTYLVFQSLAFAETPKIRTFPLNGIVYSSGQFYRSYEICNFRKIDFSDVLSLRLESGFLEFSAECDRDGFETNLIPKITTSLPSGHYQTDVFCMINLIKNRYKNAMALMSTQQVYILFTSVVDKNICPNTKDGEEQVRGQFDIYIR